MKPSFSIKLAALACIAAIAAAQACACSCGSNIHGKNSWEVAKLETEGATVIFEGTPERFELQWSLLNSKDGELIPAELFAAKSGQPRMLVTFRVQTKYKGGLGPEVVLNTGLGGGDCGAVFSTGLTYLVYAYGANLDSLQVSMCSPGGWIGNKTVAADLRYVMKEHPTSSDLEPYRPSTPALYADQEAQPKRDSEEPQKQYAAVTGTICGAVIAEKATDGNNGLVSFLSTAGYSPFTNSTASVNPDGSFCSNRLGPGKYYLHFTKVSNGSLTSAAYYPGVSERTHAATIEISAGQTLSGVTFKIPVQKGYSVRGIISADDKSQLGPNEVYVSLLSLDGRPYPTSYRQAVDFQGSFPLPKVKYFDFENVLPGRYIAYVSVLGQGRWYTKKEEVNVANHMEFISLELFHKK
jgi:hypothetical protein